MTFWPWSPALGCVAYRDEKGSDFIQTLVEVLRADPKVDLLELMTEVSWGVVGVAWEEGLDSAFFSAPVFCSPPSHRFAEGRSPLPSET